MYRRVPLLLMALGLAALAPSALAIPVTFAPGDVDNFALFSSTPSAAFSLLSASPGDYTVGWAAGVTGAVIADFRLGAVSIGSSGDDFQFYLTNTDEHPWTFGASINGGAIVSAGQLAPDARFFFDFLGITAPVTQVDLFVGRTVPVGPSQDRVAEFQVSAIPEPGTLLLIGTGLTGLALRRRRRQ